MKLPHYKTATQLRRVNGVGGAISQAAHLSCLAYRGNPLQSSRSNYRTPPKLLPLSRTFTLQATPTPDLPNKKRHRLSDAFGFLYQWPEWPSILSMPCESLLASGTIESGFGLPTVISCFGMTCKPRAVVWTCI